MRRVTMLILAVFQVLVSLFIGTGAESVTKAPTCHPGT